MKYDFENDLFAEIQSARLDLMIKVGQKMAFNWLVHKGVSVSDAFRIAKKGADQSLQTKDFSPEQILEYGEVWEKAATEISERVPLGQEEIRKSKWSIF